MARTNAKDQGKNTIPTFKVRISYACKNGLLKATTSIAGKIGSTHSSGHNVLEMFIDKELHDTS